MDRLSWVMVAFIVVMSFLPFGFAEWEEAMLFFSMVGMPSLFVIALFLGEEWKRWRLRRRLLQRRSWLSYTRP